MNKILNLCIATMATVSGMAQPQLNEPKSLSFARAMESVLHDYPANFWNISGELVLQQGEIENYASLVLLPGADECSITRYHSVEDTTASWQAKMFRNEDFALAAKQYKTLYQHLKGCYLKLIDGSIVYLRGEWEEPKEEKAFAMSTLRLVTGDWRYREMKIDLEMVYQFPEWMININVSGKKKDSLEGYADEEGR
jgi:hypothetical protein